MRLHARELRHDRAEIGSAGALQRPELHLRADGVGEAAVILDEQNAVFHISPPFPFRLHYTSAVKRMSTGRADIEKPQRVAALRFLQTVKKASQSLRPQAQIKF